MEALWSATARRDGAFVTLEPPTKPMLDEAASAGFYVSPHCGKFPQRHLIRRLERLGLKVTIKPLVEAA